MGPGRFGRIREGPEGSGQVKKGLNRSDGSAMIWKGPRGSR